MTTLKASKAQYSETEAAAELGIRVEDLRDLIRFHIVKNDAELASTPVPALQPSDLLLLRLLHAAQPLTPSSV